MEPLPEDLEGVGITEHLDEQIPLDLEFKNSDGRTVRLGEFFDQDRPVLLSLIYYRCPMLCTLVLNGMVDALKESDLVPGTDFDLLTVSFDPVETPTLARLKKQTYLQEYGVPEAGTSWHFLVGDQDAVSVLTEAVGFRYRWNDERKEFAHQAAIYVLTPDGKISRYLYGIMFEPKTLRLSLIEAGRGQIGSPLDQIILYCFHYDANSGKYSLAAMNIMRVAGILTVLVLGSTLSVQWLRGSRRKKSKQTEQA
jgi:protein SCO1/2